MTRVPVQLIAETPWRRRMDPTGSMSLARRTANGLHARLPRDAGAMPRQRALRVAARRTHRRSSPHCLTTGMPRIVEYRTGNTHRSTTLCPALEVQGTPANSQEHLPEHRRAEPGRVRRGGSGAIIGWALPAIRVPGSRPAPLRQEARSYRLAQVGRGPTGQVLPLGGADRESRRGRVPRRDAMSVWIARRSGGVRRRPGSRTTPRRSAGQRGIDQTACLNSPTVQIVARRKQPRLAAAAQSLRGTTRRLHGSARSAAPDRCRTASQGSRPCRARWRSGGQRSHGQPSISPLPERRSRR